MDVIRIALGLARFVEANVVRQDNSVAGGRQLARRVGLYNTTEVTAIEQHRCLVILVMLFGRYIYGRHSELLALVVEFEELHRPRVGVVRSV